MKTALISFTGRGSQLCSELSRALSVKGYQCEAYAFPKYADENGLIPLKEPLKDWTGRMFASMDAILFISASGIAVRSIAPFIEDKTKDPAIVVMDEKGIFAISLLSGHLGGANELAGTLANLTGAIPVITTATDVNGRFAVDVFAKKNGLFIESMEYAKAVSADVLDEKPIGLKSDFEIYGPVPDEIHLWDEEAVFEGTNGIHISLETAKQPYKQTLHLVPRIITVGIGCRKGKSAKDIEAAVLKTLEENHISIHALEQAASIELKAEEPGILEFCKKFKLPFVTYSKEKLSALKGEFSSSEFVESVTGVSNVCERSAMLGSGNGIIIQKKKAADGITIALGQRKWSVEFE